MAVDHWWLGTDGGDPTNPEVAANWSTAGSGGAPGATTPTVGDNTQFDGGGNNTCTLTVAVTWDSMTILAGFTAAFETDGFDMAFTPSTGTEGMVLDGGAGAQFDSGGSTFTITDGTFDNKDQTGWDADTSTLVMAGTGTIIGNIANPLNNLTIASGTTTVDASTTGQITVTGLCDVNGAFVINKAVVCASPGREAQLNTGAAVSGASVLVISSPQSAEGLTVFAAGATITVLVRMQRPASGAILSAGNYGGGVKVNATDGTDRILELDAAGEYTFASFEFETTSTGNLTLANSVNGPASITVTGAFTVDIDSTGDVIIDDSGQDVAWILQGSKVDEITGGGVFQWIHDLSQFPRREYLRHGGLMTGGRL